jgi:hypothetical protein
MVGSQLVVLDGTLRSRTVRMNSEGYTGVLGTVRRGAAQRSAARYGTVLYGTVR